jgi:L-2-hydroxyglutarate oxidase
MSTDVFDAIVVGAGIVGAATAAELCRRRPGWRVLVLEKEAGPARHQTGRNSGVVHSGVYYAPGSLKARMCREGLERTYAYCTARGIPIERRGKLLVATSAAELARLDALERRAGENAVAVARLDAAGLRRHEPNVAGLGALRVPATGIVDYVAMTRALLGEVEDAGGSLRFGTALAGLAQTGGGWRLNTATGTFAAERVVLCGGVQSDRLARMAGLATDLRMLPFRGDYYTLPASRAGIVHNLIYPVPDPALPFLGVHLTPMVDGRIVLGPNAVLSLAREGYGRFSLAAADAFDALSYPGLWRTLMRHPRAVAAEIASAASRRRYLRLVRTYCPALTLADLWRHHSGIRAQVVRRDGTLVDDFLILNGPGLTAVLNAPSPAATSALPIAAHICDAVL